MLSDCLKITELLLKSMGLNDAGSLKHGFVFQ